MVFSALLMVTLINANGHASAWEDHSPCSVLAGGFLGEQFSPEEAIRQFRENVWNAHEKKIATCIELRVSSREGVLTTTVFRSELRRGTWLSEIEAQRSGTETRRVETINKIQRVEISSNNVLSSNLRAEPANYKLRFDLADGSTFER